MIKRKDQRGFTIIELLMAMVFFSFILIFATASYIHINRSFVRGSNIKLVQEEARKVMSEITSAMREAGSGEVFINDEDNVNRCDPRSASLNMGTHAAPLSPTADECRRRICVGSTVIAWNQAVLDDDQASPDISEHSWYGYYNDADGTTTWLQYHPLNGSEPFSVVRSSSSGATRADCLGDISFLDSSSLVDGSRVMVQDIDVYPVNVAVPNTYMVRVSLSTRDDDSTDDQDLDYGVFPSDSQGSGVSEFKAEVCNIDAGSQEFCYVETLSTIVTIR